MPGGARPGDRDSPDRGLGVTSAQGAAAGGKNIGLVAHDNKKTDLVEWAVFNRQMLRHHHLYATGTTGALLERRLAVPVHRLRTGPLGGDLQLGAMIAEGRIDLLIFFWDPLEPQPHDPDVKALLRIAVVWNIPVASNRASADYLISSALMRGRYQRQVPDYSAYEERYALEVARRVGEPTPGSAPPGPGASLPAGTPVPEPGLG